MTVLTGLSLWLSVALFAVAVLAILVVGSRLTAAADALGERTSLGGSMSGALFLGAATAMAGIVTSVTAAATGDVQIAIGNAVGSLTAQTAALAVADAVYRRANLEHGAGAVANLGQATLLITLLTLPLLAGATPVLGLPFSPISVLMVAGYIFGLRVIQQMQQQPTWQAELTDETEGSETQSSDTETSETNPQAAGPTGGLWLRLALFMPVVGIAGLILARTGSSISTQTGLSATLIGSFFIAVATSLPELVTSISAVRRGALALAVGGVIGGNAFDTLVIAFSDFAYPYGSIYDVITAQQTFLIALAILLTGLLLLGLLRREEGGPGNIGFESVMILVFYVAGFVILAFSVSG